MGSTTTQPTVASIITNGANPTNASSLSWTVTFSAPVNNVVASDFALVTSNGISGTAPTISSVTGTGPTATWTVTASTSGTIGANGATIGLDLVSAGMIADAGGNALSTTSFTGQTYTFDTTAPAAPGAVALANGQGTGNSYINSSTQSSVSVTVSGIAEVSSSDMITVTISDGTHQVTGTAAASSGTVTVTGMNTTTLNAGTNNITISATETDAAGNVSGSTSAATAYSKDTTAPTSNAPTVPSYANTLSVPLTLNETDSGSGINTSSIVIQRKSATLTNGTCGGYGSFSPVTLSGGSDTTVITGNCYEYEEQASDNAGNGPTTSSVSAAVRVDTVSPTVSVVVGPASFTTANYLSSATTFYAYANVTDVSGVNTLTADVHNLDGNSGDTAVTLVYNATGYAVGGTTYYYRSAALTASTKTNGSTATFTATASDNAGNSTTTSNQTATWESTAPTVERRGRTGLVHDGELPVERHHFLRLRQRDRCERCEHADR